MKWRTTLVAAALVAVSSAAGAQSWLWVGGGFNKPIGDQSDSLGTGWLGSVGVGMTLKAAPAWSLQLEGLYGNLPEKVGSGGTLSMGAMANVGLDLMRESALHPYVFAGAGWMSMRPEGEAEDSDLAYQAGVGLAWKLSAKTSLWADWRYLSAGAGVSTKMIPIMAGLTIQLGSP
jgi:hypothetical protein